MSTVHIPTNHQRQLTPPLPSPSVQSIQHVPNQAKKWNHRIMNPINKSTLTPNHSTSTPAAQTPISPPNYSRATAHTHPDPCPSSCRDSRRRSNTGRSTRRLQSPERWRWCGRERLRRTRSRALGGAPRRIWLAIRGERRCRGLGAGRCGGGGLLWCTLLGSILGVVVRGSFFLGWLVGGG